VRLYDKQIIFQKNMKKLFIFTALHNSRPIRFSPKDYDFRGGGG